MRQLFIYVDDSYSEIKEYFCKNKIQNIFLVCGKSFFKLSIAKYLKKIQDTCGINIEYFSNFSPNPQYESVVCGVSLFKKKKYDLIIACGGGSAIDVAKCIKLYSNMSEESDYLHQEIIVNTSIPFLVIPTTAGTGSEATKYAVIYNEGTKQSITHYSIIPNVVVYDYRVLELLPNYHKRASMLDALCHGIEAFWSVNSTEESRLYSERAIKLIIQNYKKYLKNDSSCYKNMLLAAYWAGKAINITQTTAGHAMSYKLTSLYGLAHGHAVALCVSVLWKYMLNNLNLCKDARGEKYLREMFYELDKFFSSNSNLNAADKFINLLRELGLNKPDLRSTDDIKLLANSVNQDRLKNNPIYLDSDNIRILYEKVFNRGIYGHREIY